jgi:hypothetical protein
MRTITALERFPNFCKTFKITGLYKPQLFFEELTGIIKNYSLVLIQSHFKRNTSQSEPTIK